MSPASSSSNAPLANEHLRATPLVEGLSDDQLTLLAHNFTRGELAAGERLFSAGERARALYLLVEGEVTLSEGDHVRMTLHPPAPIGELGVLSPGIIRNTTATATKRSVVWSVSREQLAAFLGKEPELGLVIYRNLTQVVAEKIRRDQIRLEDMRCNIIRTQKTMKQLRDFVLESEDTPVSDRIHDALEQMIVHNRRANYRVAPPQTLPAMVRIDGAEGLLVVEVSRTHLSYLHEHGALPREQTDIIGVLSFDGPEIPISGRVLRIIERRVDVELDLLLDEYVSVLEGYLSRVQMVDFVV